MKNTFIMDACALLALFGNEPGANKISEYIRKADNKSILLKINHKKFNECVLQHKLHAGFAGDCRLHEALSQV